MTLWWHITSDFIPLEKILCKIYLKFQAEMRISQDSTKNFFGNLKLDFYELFQNYKCLCDFFRNVSKKIIFGMNLSENASIQGRIQKFKRTWGLDFNFLCRQKI